jgi:hypothetical protein
MNPLNNWFENILRDFDSWDPERDRLWRLVDVIRPPGGALEPRDETRPLTRRALVRWRKRANAAIRARSNRKVFMRAYFELAFSGFLGSAERATAFELLRSEA